MTSSTKATPSKVGGAALKENRNSWVWGFTPQAENWNGRLAMVGFVAALMIELFSSQGVLHFWNFI